MNYLQLLDTIRSITGRRQHDRFPPVEAGLKVFRHDGAKGATFVVYDALLAKAVLQSPNYRQFNFLQQILTIAKPERTKWIRRFCEIGLIMLDGPEHQRRRPLMQRSLEKCASGLKAIPDHEIVSVIESGIAAEVATSATIASRLVVFLFSKAISELVGKPVQLPARDLFAVDFFNPFPTLSSLARCDESIGNCCEATGFDELEESEQTAVLSLLVMGVSPMHALFTTLLNSYVSGLQAGLESAEAVRASTGWNSYEIVPTNFVMRTCVVSDMLGEKLVQPGDIAYLFLGSATGCPFSRVTSVPFGAGLHLCSGAALTQVMTNAVRNGLIHTQVDGSRIMQSEEFQGKAAAFLGFNMAS